MSNQDDTHIHSFVKTEIPSTCCERGYTLYRCECGAEHKENYKPLAPHNYILMEENNVNCTMSGERKYVCSVCGEMKTEEVLPMGHNFGEWMTQKFATCTEDGSEVRVCNRCGIKEERIIKSKGHKLINPKTVESGEGSIEFFCENCGQTIVLNESEAREIMKNNSTVDGGKFKKAIKIYIPVLIVLLLLVVIVAAMVNHREYRNTLDNYFKAFETQDIELLYDYVYAGYWIDYCEKEYDDGYDFIRKVYDFELEQYHQNGYNIKIDYDVDDTRASKKELKELEDAIYKSCAGHVYERNEFEILDAYKLSVNFTIEGEDDTTDYWTMLLIIKEKSGEWRIAEGDFVCPFYDGTYY